MVCGESVMVGRCGGKGGGVVEEIGMRDREDEGKQRHGKAK